MRVQVTRMAQEDAARRLEGMLWKSGYAVVESRPDYTIHLVRSESNFIEIDSIDSELERYIVNMIAELTTTSILLKRAGGIRSDREIRIGIPGNELDQVAVENGTLRALDRETQRVTQRTRTVRQSPLFLLPWAICLILVASFALFFYYTHRG